MRNLFQARQLATIMTAQSTSTYANQVIAFVVPWLVLSRTGSAQSAGLVAFVLAITAIAGTLLGGIISDRMGGRWMSAIADGLSLVTAILLALVLVFDLFSLWIVIATQVLGILFDGPGQIAKNTMIPAAAGREKVPLGRAMGLQQTIQNGAMFVGPLSAGLLIALFTESLTLALAGGLFLLSIVLVLRLPQQTLIHEHRASVRQAYRDLLLAISFIRHEPFLGPMQLFGPFYAFVLLPISTVVFPAWFVLQHQSSGALGLFLGVQAVGGILGGLLFAAWGPKVSQRGWLFGATAAYAAALVGLSFVAAGSWLALILAFLAGLAVTGIMVIPYTAFYARTPQHLLGRVNSLGAATGYLASALGALAFGWVITATSASVGLMICAVTMGLVAIGVEAFGFMKRLDEPHSSPASS